MATLPFDPELDIGELLKEMESIPVDAAVPYSEDFKRLVQSGKAWGPQASAESKLATRLFYAGWTTQQIDQVGLKSKNVENFRRKHKHLVQARPGRPPKLPNSVAEQLNAIPKSNADFAKELEETRRALEQTIETAQAELKVVNEALELFNKLLHSRGT